MHALKGSSTVDMFFGIQVMERYIIPETPAESRRSEGSPHFCFRTATSFALHEWHITRVALIFIRDQVGDTTRYNGIIQFDPKDRTFADGLEVLMTRDEEIAPGDAEKDIGLGQILSEVVYIISYNWNAFIKEAENHLQVLVSQSQSPAIVIK